MVRGEVEHRLQPPRQPLPQAVFGEDVDDSEVVSANYNSKLQYC